MAEHWNSPRPNASYLQLAYRWVWSSESCLLGSVGDYGSVIALETSYLTFCPGFCSQFTSRPRLAAGLAVQPLTGPSYY